MSPEALQSLAAALPAPATPGLAYPDPLWSAGRLRSLEGQRQIDGETIARMRAAIEALKATIVRLRADLALAGRALDGLTAPAERS